MGDRLGWDIISPTIKAAIVARCAPGESKLIIRQLAPGIGADYHLLRNAINEYVLSGTEFDNRGLRDSVDNIKQDNSNDMDVGAIYDQSDMKGYKVGKGKGDKGMLHNLEGGGGGKSHNYKGQLKGNYVK